MESDVSVGISRVDNVRLQTVDRRSATVYRVQPSLSLTQTSQRFNSNIDALVQGFYYSEQSESEAYQIFNANLSAALDPENFFVNMGGSRSQVIIDPDGPIPRGNLVRTDNRTQQDGVYFGPELQYSIGPNVTVAAGWRRRWWDYDIDVDPGEPLPIRSDFSTDSTSFSLDNYRRTRGLAWAIRYLALEADYEGLPTWENRRAMIELGAWLSESLRIFAVGGKESPWDDPFNGDLEDSFWEAGVARTVGDSVDLEVAAGERSFGSSKRASVDIRFRNGSTALSYSEQPTTQRGDEFGANFGRTAIRRFDRSLADDDLSASDLLPNEVTQDFLSRAGLAESYLSKRLAWSLGIDRRRTQLFAGAYADERTNRVTLTGTPLRDVDQFSVSLGMTRELGSRTSLTASVGRTRREYSSLTSDALRERDFTELSVNAAYALGPRSELSLDFRRQEDDDVGGNQRDYNQLTLFFTRTFLGG